jgi:hypothetical protein
MTVKPANLLKAPTGFKSAPPAGMRRVFIGIPKTDVGIGASADVSTTVLEDFALERPFLSPAAQALGVLNIRVGTKPLNVSGAPISGNAFSESAINNELSGYRCKANAAITITFINQTAAVIPAGGGFYGWAQM